MNPTDLLPSEMRRQMASLATIEREVAASFGITVDDLYRQGRETRVAWPRQVAMHAMRKLTKATMKIIAERFGKHHGTVLHAERAVQSAIDSYPKLKREILDIHAKIIAHENSCSVPKIKVADIPYSTGGIRIL